MRSQFHKQTSAERESPLSPQRLLDYWNSHASHLRLQRRQEILKKILGEAQCLLEVGCGIGTFHGVFNQKTQVICTDLIESNLAYGIKQGWLRLGKTLTTDAHQLPFANDSFDGIFGNAMLHHLNAAAALKEFHRILKPGGTIVFFEPNMANPIVWMIKNWDWLGRRYHEIPGETAFYQPELKMLARGAHFENVKVEHFDFCLGPSALLPVVQSLEPHLESAFTKKISRCLLLKATKQSN